jgi:hypothetical protein
MYAQEIYCDEKPLLTEERHAELILYPLMLKLVYYICNVGTIGMHNTEIKQKFP